jgi:hypothetical protein
LPLRSARGVGFAFKTFPGDWPIQYLLEPHHGSEFLFVVFPALSAEFEYKFNYHRVLAGVRVKRLFVLDDFGPQGSYLIASDGSIELGEAVCSMIESVRLQLGIEKSKVIPMGLSKGGASALYFANRLEYGRIVVNGPQTRIGHFLLEQDRQNGPRLANYMFPGTEIHVGRGDHHFESHAMPYFEYIRKQGGHIELDVGEYSEHRDLGVHYPVFIEDTLRDVFGIKMRKLPSNPALTFVVSA